MFRKRRPLLDIQQNQGISKFLLKVINALYKYDLISRKLNRECLFLNFFDKHDIWHFLGGAGLFFAFLFILTIDDDIRFRRTDMLSIF